MSLLNFIYQFGENIVDTMEIIYTLKTIFTYCDFCKRKYEPPKKKNNYYTKSRSRFKVIIGKLNQLIIPVVSYIVFHATQQI